MAKVIRVDMSAKKVSTSEPGELEKKGGRAFTSTVVAKEVPPDCHPLSADNRLVISSGLLSGTNAANSGRLSIGGKSPLTGGIKESNVGGTASYRLARLDVRGIVVEGRGDGLHYLLINKDGAELLPADDLKGLGNYDTAERLKEKHGNKVAVVSIGQAGELKLSAASIAVTDTNGRPARHAGRGGMGAVMGSKGLKAIVIDDKDAGGVEYADKDAFKESAGNFRDTLKGHPVTKPDGGGLATFGTNTLVSVINASGAFPTRNFKTGQFEGAANISGEKMHDTIKDRGGDTTHSACTTCIIQCSNVYVDDKGEYVTSGLEYETVWANGANCGIDDLDAIARIDRLCDDTGLDTIEIGCAVAVAMDGGLIEFGDTKGAYKLVEEVKNGTALGRIIGSGAAVTGQAFGVDRVPVVKKQSMPAYDPRAVKGVGVTYATTPMGADHTAGYGVTANILSVGGTVDPHKNAGNIELSQGLQVATAAIDAAGLCLFVAFAVLDNEDGLPTVTKMLNARYGLSLTPDDIRELGKSILRNEKAFNKKAGFTDIDDQLPEMFTDPVPPHNVSWDFTTEELQKTLHF